MVDGRYLKKLKISTSPQWFKGSHKNLAGWRSGLLWTPSHVQNL